MKHENKPFVGETVQLDGNEFRNCQFSRCKLVFSGGVPPALVGNDIAGDNFWVFEGAAANTFVFMSGLYRDGAKSLIEATFEQIRGNSKAGITLN